MTGLLTRLLGRIGLGPAARRPMVPAPPAPSVVERDVHVDPASPVAVGESCVRRIVAASRGVSGMGSARDPLGLRVDAAHLRDEGLDRALHLARAALGGTLAVPDDQERADILPATRAMLRAACVNPDAFAALAALSVSGGLYVEDFQGYTIAKAIGGYHQYDADEKQYVRVRIPASGSRDRITFWQRLDGRCEMAISPLPETVVGMLVGRRLSDLVTIRPEDDDGMVVDSVEEADDMDGIMPAMVIRLRPGGADRSAD